VRLLVVTQYFWPENFRINDLVAELLQRGHEVTVLTGHPNYPDGAVFPDFRRDPARYGRFHGAEVLRVPMLSRGQGGARLAFNYLSFALSASLLGSWKLRGRSFEAIFAYEPSPVTVGIPAALLRRLKRVPMAFWVLDLWPETLQALGVVRSRAMLRMVGALVAFIYARCDLILAQSRSFIPQIGKYCRQSARIEYFPSWSEAAPPASSVVRAPEVLARAGSFDIVFTGNIGDAQDFPAVLAAAELLGQQADVRWLLVGDGRMAGWVAQEVTRRGLQDRVLLLGRFPLERMPSFYAHADALLVSLKDDPIFSMTIPAKLQSYLAAGVPIVAMLNGEGAAIVEHSGAGVTCASGDAAGLAAAVMRLVAATREQRAEMGRRGLHLSTGEFDRTRLITQLETWLAELPALPGRSGRLHS
jgi:glycosyltransferase involved in cell wall biosynthesis